MNRASLQRLRLREPPSAGAPRTRGRRSPDVTRGLGEGEGGQEPLSPPPKPPEFLRVSDATRSHSSTSPDLCCDLVCHTVVPRSLALPLVYTYIYIDEKGPYLVHFLLSEEAKHSALRLDTLMAATACHKHGGRFQHRPRSMFGYSAPERKEAWPFHFHQARKAHFGTQPAKGLGNRAQCE